MFCSSLKTVSLWEYLNTSNKKKLPIPEIQIIGGGAHAKGSIPIQDFMIIPNGATDFYTALHWTFKIYRKAGEKLYESKNLFGVADEGGYWPNFGNITKVLDFLTSIIEDAGFTPFKDVSISLDVAANNFKEHNQYRLSNEESLISPEKLYDTILSLIDKYPIISIEDPFAEEDIEYFSKLKSCSSPLIL